MRMITTTFWYHKTNKAVTSKDKSAKRQNLALQEYLTFELLISRSRHLYALLKEDI